MNYLINLLKHNIALWQSIIALVSVVNLHKKTNDMTNV